MRIAFDGTCNCGKTTLIEDFIKRWSMYSTPKKRYTDLEVNLNSEGDEKSQGAIRDFMFEQARSYSIKDHIVHDRSMLSNLAYTMHLFQRGKISDEFLAESIDLTRRSMTAYDIIFFIPLTKIHDVELDEKKNDRDLEIREPIDKILKTFNYLFNLGVEDHPDYSKKMDLFPSDNSAGIIEIFGDRETRIALISQYINEHGNLFGEGEGFTLFDSNEKVIAGDKDYISKEDMFSTDERKKKEGSFELY